MLSFKRRSTATGRNDSLRLRGDKFQDIRFDYDYKSGRKGTDKAGSDFKFSGGGFTHVLEHLIELPQLTALPVG